MNITTIFHIGYPKTASTWFQKKFYPKVNNYSILDKNVLFEEIISQNFNKIKIESIFDKKKSNILCDERLCGDFNSLWINGIFLNEIIKRLYDLDPNAHIVLFIRNQRDIICSSYLQYIKGGGNYSINRFIHNNFNYFKAQKMQLFSLDFFNYDLIIDKILEKFPKERVHLFLYEEFKNSPDQFLNKFCKELQITISSLPQNLHENPRHRNLFMIHFNRFLNLFTAERVVNKRYIFHIPKFHRYIFKIMFYCNKLYTQKKINTTKVLGKKNIDEINEYFKNSNKELIKKHNLLEIIKYDYPI